MNSIEFKQKYDDTKLEILLPEDIDLMKAITEAVHNFPLLTDADQLIELESKLSEMSYRLAGIVGRLSGQYEMRYRNLKKKISDRTTELMSGKERGGYARAGELADAEFTEERVKIGVIEGILDEYKNKAYSLKDVFLAITHKLHKLNKQ
jgi:hypothetical protein